MVQKHIFLMKSIHDYCEQSDGDLFGGNESDMDGEKEVKDEGRSQVIETQTVSVMFLYHL